MPYIYVLRDPDSQEVRYVGKTNNIKHRMQLHHAYARKVKLTYCARWLRGLVLENKEPIVEIVEEVSSDNWPEAEKRWIAYYLALGAPLTNMTEGGDSVIPLGLTEEEFRRRISEGVRRKGQDPEWRKSLGNATRGKKLSPEWRAKIGASQKGKAISVEAIRKAKETRKRNNKPLPPWSDERRAILSAKLRGQKRTPEQCARISASHKGRKYPPLTDEHKEKLRIVNLGKVVSQETRARLSAAKKGMKQPPHVTAIQREKCSGEGNGRAKLTVQQIAEIRQKRSEGWTLVRLAAEYGVHFSQIGRIAKGLAWKSVVNP